MNKIKTHTRQISSPHLTSYQHQLYRTPQSHKNVEEQFNKSLTTNDKSMFSCGSATALKQASSPMSKFYSFKKIREDKVREKDQKGKIILKVKLDNYENRIKTQSYDRINDLNDARTITSVESPRDSDSGSSPLDESQIISRGYQAFDVSSSSSHINSLFPFVRRKPQICKIHHPHLNLIIDKSTKWICHYQISEYNIGEIVINKLNSLSSNSILQLYGQHKLPDYKYLLIYQPFQWQFNTFINQSINLKFQLIIDYMKQLITIMANFRDHQLYSPIKIHNMKISQNKIKLKINQIFQYGKQKQMIKDIGNIGNILFSKFKSSGKKNVSKFKQLRYSTIINDMINGFENSLQYSYMRLSCLKDQ